MSSTTSKRFGIATGSVLVVLAVTLGVVAGSANTAGQAGWLKGLNVRGEALNRAHGLGTYAVRTQIAPGSDWQQALELRSEALNRAYGLGKYAIAAP